ncbi:MAG: efflux transporter periplasmic adaptor subunit [Marinomonas sp.]|jgi:membrane fusion protein (multidrug efflux system)|uniref:Membrane fusion protein (Multidrug efflux system) n=1 Tax=Marinomonas communis TaxID=28254 RepID=A0A4R6X7B5_9GAMM|nr:efflux RND transporter periplasmic adaptor subunit [Marinomonas communis]RUM55671.1 MAG: efflux transporter periplasmic adaptor subunit [Marinomonas sp.]TDR12633.1 membrane fusion protein (multidrug efflux system) [Marinomonas communis]
MLSRNILITGVVLASAILAGCQESESSAAASAPAQQAPKTQVGVITIEKQEVKLTSELPGRTKSSLEAEIRPQVGGIVEKRLFEEGQTVSAGDLLYQLDDSVYESNLEQAQADLDSARATLTSTKQTYERYRQLKERNNVSQQNLDDANVAYLSAVADEKRAVAALNSAKIDLAYTKITAPIDGKIGISDVTVGALVTAGQSTAMTTIRAMDPMFVDLAQTSVEQLRQRTLLSLDHVSLGDQSVTLTLEDGSEYPYKGRLKTREVNVDEMTGSVTLRAEFDNPDGLLLPGMFVRGQINDLNDSEAILVPQQGVSRDVKGNAIAYVVNADNKVEQRILETERSIGNQWYVTDGIKAGDRVVVQGSLKIRPGAEVNAVELQRDPQTGRIVEANAATTGQ